MKKIAIIGIMFLSVGAFAQQRVQSNEKERVCAMELDQLQESSKMKLVPIGEVGPEKTLRMQSGKVQQRNQARKSHFIERRAVPLRAKSLRADVKA